mgnify:CR=1 FL=1
MAHEAEEHDIAPMLLVKASATCEWMWRDESYVIPEGWVATITYRPRYEGDEGAALAKSSYKKVIKKIGIFRVKAKSIYNLSKILIKEHESKVPRTFEELEKLPGVGHKTASVVMSQGFGFPAFPIDTHIHRLAQRWGLTNGKNVKTTENDLKKLFPSEKWNKLHLQIIFYGREFCSAWGCNGTVCKICKTCYPKRKKPIITKKS